MSSNSFSERFGVGGLFESFSGLSSFWVSSSDSISSSVESGPLFLFSRLSRLFFLDVVLSKKLAIDSIVSSPLFCSFGNLL